MNRFVGLLFAHPLFFLVHYFGKCLPRPMGGGLLVSLQA